jgi:AraC-like DNA-binding protein
MTEIFDDIRKLYRFKNPCAELAEYIEFFSETSPEAMDRYITTSQFTVKLFPSYTPTIWVNLGSPYYLKNGQEWHSIDEHTDVLLLRNEIVERKNLPTDNIFTIKFFPGGFEAISGFSQTRIGSDIIPATEIIPASLIHKMKNLGCFEDRLQLLQQFFLEKIEKHHGNDHSLQYVKQAITKFYESGMKASNQELASQVYITDKTLYRYFSNVVGANPKTYFATVRARMALTAYVKETATFSPYDHGYYDMSHFYKDVVKFTGQKLSLATQRSQ